ncbi:SHOCT domain-containing protein [Clostridium botulinum]|nr:SHOCT domain-containing protein [Clostridium botulinum]EKO2042250.1 SHOCT domain-containing protein [Clostridium botulinum]
MLLSLKGVNGQLELYEDKVIIKRKGILAKLSQGFTKGDKTIYLRQIAGIDLKPGGNLVNGYIQFTLPGGNEKTKGAFEATQDENSIMFLKKYNDVAMQIKQKIEELQQQGHNPITSGADELRKYKELMDDGIITEDEFNKKKKELLGI